MSIADIQPFIYLVTIVLAAGFLWALLTRAFKAALAFAAVAIVTYGGLWLVNGQPPVVPAEFGRWLDTLPDTIGSWIEWARDLAN